jgi:hypothetical protein
MQPDLNTDIVNNEPDEEWVPNVEFDSNKVKWNDESGSEDDIESVNEEDFLDKTEEERPGVNPRKSMLETVIREAGHLCIFLPKFHCELNPIEMVGFSLFLFTLFFNHLHIHIFAVLEMN